jgi:hypothetical protein
MRGAVAMGVVTLVGLAAACGYDSNGGYGGTNPNPPVNAQVVTAAGDLTAAVAQFRALLPDTANKVVGQQVQGRREINWEGVAGAILNVDTFPGDQFNRVVPRGQIVSTPGTGLRVSDNAFFDLEPTDSTQFVAFSGKKTFASIGSTIMDVVFRVAGTDSAAAVQGFGVVFSDVDVAGATTIEFFGSNGASLKKITVPVRNDAVGFSFAGAVFESPLATRVRITAGQTAIGAGIKDISAGGTKDLVVTDDFIASEPRPIQ